MFAFNETPAKARRSSGWSARIVASGISGSGSRGMREGYGALSGTASLSNIASASPDYVKLGESAATDIMILNQYSKTYTEIHHNPPVRAGMLLSYGLGNRLSIESGLTYTYLSSKLRSGSEQHYYETLQNLHYIGIPANLNYSLWSNDRFSVYLSGGGMVEQNISGSASTEYTDGENTFSKENERVRVTQTQWSVNASAGLQYNFSRRVGLFADPGISYHFDNGSPIETVYKKNPLNFDLTFGLRISLDKL
jgi:hypothetical protein